MEHACRLGVVPAQENGTVEIEQELNLGVLPVEIEFKNSEPVKVTMTQGKWESSGQVTDVTGISKLATGLGLELSDIDVDKNLPIEVVSTGIKSIDIPICTLEALGRIRVNTSVLADAYLPHGAVGCYAFTFETKEDQLVRPRAIFPPNDGILEDPATGSAAGGTLRLSGQSRRRQRRLLHDRAGRYYGPAEPDICRRNRRSRKCRTRKDRRQLVVVAKGEIYL